MHPLKKSVVKKKKKKLPTKAAAAAAVKLPIIENHPNEVNSNNYLQQINNLEEILAKYQKKCDQLEILLSKTDGQFTSILNDKKSIVNFLKKELEIKNDKLIELNNEIFSLTTLNESNSSEYKQEIEKLKKNYEEKIDNSAIEIESLNKKLHGLMEFMKDQEATKTHVKELEDLVDKLKAEHEEEIYNLEKSHLFDKNKLKNEMKTQLNELASEFRHLLYDRMNDSTKRLIKENVLLNSKLKNFTNGLQSVHDENEKLKIKDLNQRLKIESLDYMQKDFARKFIATKQVAKMLMEKVGDENGLREAFDNAQKELEQCKNENYFINQKSMELNSRINEAESVNAQKDQQIEITEDYTKKLKVYKKKLEELLQNSANVIMSALYKNNSEDAHKICKNELLEQLLVILNSTKNIGLELEPVETENVENNRFYSKFSGLTDAIKTKDTMYISRNRNTKLHEFSRMTEKLKVTKTVNNQNNYKILKKEIGTQTFSTLSAHLYSIMLTDVNKKIKQEF